MEIVTEEETKSREVCCVFLVVGLRGGEVFKCLYVVGQRIGENVEEWDPTVTTTQPYEMLEKR